MPSDEPLAFIILLFKSNFILYLPVITKAFKAPRVWGSPFIQNDPLGHIFLKKHFFKGITKGQLLRFSFYLMFNSLSSLTRQQISQTHRDGILFVFFEDKQSA